MRLVFLLEEASMKCLLDQLLPRFLPKGVSFSTISHEGKSDLQKSIPVKLRGWNVPNVKFIIVHDQDANDCVLLKKKLLELCSSAGKEVVVRIACHELEAWYFGDLRAVSKAYGRDFTKLGAKSRYRDADGIINPKQELRRLIPEHEQISGARRIAPYMSLDKNTSVSFNHFISAVRRLCE